MYNSFLSLSEHEVQVKGYSVQGGFNSKSPVQANYRTLRADVEFMLCLVLASLQQKIRQQK